MVILLIWTMVFPALYAIWKKWKVYPVGYDCLYLPSSGSTCWGIGSISTMWSTTGIYSAFPQAGGDGLDLRGLSPLHVLAATGMLV